MPRRLLGLRQQVALLVGKGQHAMKIRHIGQLRLGMQGQAQHSGRVAQVEGVVVRQLECGYVAWVRMHQGL